jgi:hypothetical protein
LNVRLRHDREGWLAREPKLTNSQMRMKYSRSGNNRLSALKDRKELKKVGEWSDYLQPPVLPTMNRSISGDSIVFFGKCLERLGFLLLPLLTFREEDG